MSSDGIQKERAVSLKRSRSGHIAHLSRLYKDAETLMIDRQNIDEVLNICDKISAQYDRFLQAHLAYIEVIEEPREKEEAEQACQIQKTVKDEFQEHSDEWLITAHASQAEGDHAISSHSSHAGSTHSTVRSTSSVTKLKEAMAQKALAKLQMQQLEQQQIIEQQQQELWRRSQALQARSAIEKADLEASIWKEEVKREMDIKREDVTNPHGLNVQARSFIPPTDLATQTPNDSIPQDLRKEVTFTSNPNLQQTTGVQSSTQSISGINELLNRQEELSKQQQHCYQTMASVLQQSITLPNPEILSFSGKATEYWKFISSYDTNVAGRVEDDGVKLSYLIQYCQGEAKSCIEDCVILEPSNGYKKAREILRRRYGQPHIISRTYINQLRDGPPLKCSDSTELIRLATDMTKCEMTLQQMGYVADMNNSDTLLGITRRLPMYLRAKWAEKAHFIIENGNEPNFSHLVKFVEDKARSANTIYGKDLTTSSHLKGIAKPKFKSNQEFVHSKQTTLAVQGQNMHDEIQKDKAYTPKLTKCVDCSGNHNLAKCDSFRAKSYGERMAVMRQHYLCFNCFGHGHSARNCRKSECTKEGCQWKHHTLLHPPFRKDGEATPAVRELGNESKSKITSGVCASTGAGSGSKVCLRVVPVKVVGHDLQTVETYALLDDGSDVSLCTNNLIRRLGLTGTPKGYSLTTVNQCTNQQGLEVNLTVKSLDDSESVQLDRVWTVNNLPVSPASIPNKHDIEKWPHLSDVDIYDIDEQEISLLIGSDTPEAFWTLDERRGGRKEPYAIRSLLGWTLMGPTSGKSDAFKGHVNLQHFEDTLYQQVEHMWKTDFSDALFDTNTTLSVEDKRALASMNDSVVKTDDGHYELGLPWKYETAYLPNNRPLAEARLRHLKRRLDKDQHLHQQYKDTVGQYIKKGYATKVPEDKLQSGGMQWYLPHHPVINPQKPEKVRVVFDCAAKANGTSLNDQLLQGPNQTSSIVGVLSRFRKCNVAFVADVEAMFHQVRVKPSDCDALRFLWWTNGDTSRPPEDYQMEVHLFGATSSPSCAGFALRKTADDNRDKYDAATIDTVYRNFYVDDCLKSTECSDSAIVMVSQLRSLLAEGGFRLHKWFSNSHELMSTIPQSERATSVVNLDLDGLTMERTLGMVWDVNQDKFRFRPFQKDKPLTRRGILSQVSSLYDPLGFVAPVTLPAKLLLQQLCLQKLGWDDAIPDRNITQWNGWLDDLMGLSGVELDRCFMPKGFGEPVYVQLHHFADASEYGYGAVSYLRLKNAVGSRHCAFVMGKSRLAPLKKVTIPRLELSAAVVAVKLDRMLRQELDLNVMESVFWTDSTSVLQYIQNESLRFKTFVANRLALIHESSTPSQWRHVASKLNPADHASRGIKVEQQQKLSMWLNGPSFLWEAETQWPQSPESITGLRTDDPEWKRETNINLVREHSGLYDLFTSYSSWFQLQKAVVWLTRFKSYLRQRFLEKVPLKNIQYNRHHINIQEVHKATEDIVKCIQSSQYSKEVLALQNCSSDKGHSKLKGALCNLNPVMENGILRVGGRIDRAPLSYDMRHPIILPCKHHVTDLIIHHFHVMNGHSGLSQVLASSREQYWIVRGRSAVRRVLNRCFQCKVRHATKLTQQMAPLPRERLIPDKPPFTYVGVDYFGPMYVKQGRKSVKRYGCLFTCFTTRAVHIEITHSMDLCSFLCALQRLVSRRGKPEKIFSDNGTNFHGGNRELRESIGEWNQQHLNTTMIQKDITWQFNPPKASHMGGVWERMIRSVKSILKSLLREQLVSDETLLTLMAEVEKILNDRPITAVSDDVSDPEPLSPSKLLLLKGNSSFPPGVFNVGDSYCRRWWRQAQYLANIFWRRWTREYLPTLQVRQKWIQLQRNLQVGDIVLVTDENTPRGQWPLGRILKTHPDQNGHVRSVKLQIGSSIKVRPIHKLCFLEHDATTNEASDNSNEITDIQTQVNEGIVDCSGAKAHNDGVNKTDLHHRRSSRSRQKPIKFNDYVQY